MLAGRDFEPTDNETSPPVIAINEAMARRYFGKDNPIGRPTSAGTIVAVVKYTKYDSLRARSRAVVYCPYLQSQAAWNDAQTLAIRTTGDPLQFVPPVRRVVRESIRTFPFVSVRRMNLSMNPSGRSGYLQHLRAC